MRPIDFVAARFTIVHGAAPKLRAKCPAHGSHGGTLAIAENRDGTVLLKCHAGCDLAAIVRAAGMTIADLFPDSDALRKRDVERARLRRQYLRAPRETLRSAIARGIEDTKARLRGELGYDRPLRAADINAVRDRVNAIFDVQLAPIAPFDWEWPPHDDDPAWPALFAHSLRNVMIAKWADPQRTPDSADLLSAATRAARELREMARTAAS